MMRTGLAMLIEQEPDLVVCGHADNAPQALVAIVRFKPALAIVDISLKGSDGIDLVKDIRLQHPDLKVLVLSMHDESLYAQRALRAGARGYVMKQEATEQILTALRRVLNGSVYVSERVNDILLQQLLNSHPSDPLPLLQRLSDRELQVLRLLGQGQSSRRVAEELSLAMQTVQSHRKHLLDKLELKNATELLQFATRWISKGESW